MNYVISILKMIKAFVTSLRTLTLVAKEVNSFELLGLSSVFLPTLIASIGFFFGKTVSPVYFYLVAATLLIYAFYTSWRLGVSVLITLTLCAILTAYTFSYTGMDAQHYHFPMQHLLRNGWNPVFDSNIEKFAAVAGDAHLAIYHTLFLPKFSALTGAIVASALGLFAGDAFLGYILIACLFSTSFRFAKRYWGAKTLPAIVFAASMTLSTKITSFMAGEVAYSTYASLCIASLMLVLYIRDGLSKDLSVFLMSACVCMSSKTTGILNCSILIAMMLPLLYNRIRFWRSMLFLVVLVVIVGASPLLTAWIQYGAPFYPTVSFNPQIPTVDITYDFTGNADALSMGYMSRMCYAWVSPKLTIALIRLISGNPDFAPVFYVGGGVAGLGNWFNVLFVISIILLCVSRKNLITLLCVILFISSNFVPLKYIGYSRYFPQIWAIFPLSVMNFMYSYREIGFLRFVRRYLALALLVLMGSFAVFTLARSVAFWGRQFAMEKIRQDRIAKFPHGRPVKVDGGEWSYVYTYVARFHQAGLNLVKSEDGNVDTVMHYGTSLPCAGVNEQPQQEINLRFPIVDGVRSLFSFNWYEAFRRLPEVLWDKRG